MVVEAIVAVGLCTASGGVELGRAGELDRPDRWGDFAGEGVVGSRPGEDGRRRRMEIDFFKLVGVSTATVIGPTPFRKGNSSSDTREAASDKARDRTRTESMTLVESFKMGSGRVSNRSL